MPATVVFTTGRVVEHPTGMEIHERNGMFRVLSADGKELAAHNADAVESYTVNGKRIELRPA
jgi:hypothetical protein